MSSSRFSFSKAFLASAAFGLAAGAAHAATITKANTQTELSLPVSWVGNAAPTAGDTATWNSTSLGAGLTIVGGTQTWGGISITGALTNIDITGAGTITTGNITLAGTKTLAIANAITLSGASIYNIADATASPATDATISGIISGGFGMTKTGAGTLVLTRANTYTGNTTINGGTLSLTGATGDGNGALASASIVINNGGTLELASGDAVGYTVGRNVLTINSGGTVTAAAGFRATIRNNITLTGGTLTGVGAGDVWGNYSMFNGFGIVATSDASGNAATISAPRFALQDSGGQTPFAVTRGAATPLNDLVVSGAIVTMNGSTNGISKSGNGVMLLSGANTYIGTTTINAGILRAGSSTALGNNSAVILANVAGATLDVAGQSLVIGSLAGGVIGTNGNVTIGAGGTLTTGGNNSSTTYTGVISGAGGFTKTGSGTQILQGANTFTGATTVSDGVLQLGNGGATGTLSTGAIVIASGTLRVNHDASAVVTLAGAISGPGALTLAGAAGSVTLLSGSNNAYTGATTVSSGTLRAGSATAFGTSAVTLANVAGVVLDVNNKTVGVGSLSGGGATGGNVTLGTGTLTLGLDNTSPTYAGVISGAGNLVKAGTGTQILTGANTYTGTTAITGGVLQINTGGTLGPSVAAISTVTGSSLAFNLSGPLPVSNAITGTGGITQMGTGTTTLNGANTYSGVTTVSNGTLKAGTASAFGTSSLSMSGGFVDLNGFAASFGSLSGIGGTINAGSASLTFGADNTSQDFAGVISGSGQVTKLGTGTQTLSGANTYTGATAINAGTLKLNSAGALGGSALTGASIVSGATLDLNGQSPSAAVPIGLAGTGVGNNGALINSNTLTPSTVAGMVNLSASASVGGAGNTTFSGAIGGSGNLTKVGAGTVILAQDNTYSGSTTVSGGTLQLGNGGTTGSFGGTTVAVASGASLAFNYGGNDRSIPTIITGAGGVTQNGTGILTLTGANTYTGSTFINSGTVRSGSPTGLGVNGAVFVAGPGTLDLNSSALTIGGLTGAGAVTLGSATLTVSGTTAGATFSGVVSGTGAVTKTGSGIQILTGANTYDGLTTVSAGTLRLGAAGALGSTVAGTVVNNGGVLDLNGATVPAGESLTLNGTGIFNGGALINTGAASTVAGPVSLATTAGIGGARNMTISGNITGPGGFTKVGAGTVTLTGTNTFSGATTIAAGALRVGSAGALSPNSTLTVSGGTLDLNNQSATLGGLAGSGVIILGTGNLTVGTDNSSSTFAAGSFTSPSVTTVTVTGPDTVTDTSQTFIFGGIVGTTTSQTNIISGAPPNTFTRTVITVNTKPDLATPAGTFTKTGTGVLELYNSYFNGNVVVAQGALLSAGRNNAPDVHWTSSTPTPPSGTKQSFTGNVAGIGGTYGEIPLLGLGDTFKSWSFDATGNSVTASSQVDFGPVSTSIRNGARLSFQNTSFTYGYSNDTTYSLRYNGVNNLHSDAQGEFQTGLDDTYRIAIHSTLPADSSELGLLTGKGRLYKTGAGSLTILNDATFTGDVLLASGLTTLDSGGGAALGSVNSVNLGHLGGSGTVILYKASVTYPSGTATATDSATLSPQFIGWAAATLAMNQDQRIGSLQVYKDPNTNQQSRKYEILMTGWNPGEGVTDGNDRFGNGFDSTIQLNGHKLTVTQKLAGFYAGNIQGGAGSVFEKTGTGDLYLRGIGSNFETLSISGGRLIASVGNLGHNVELATGAQLKIVQTNSGTLTAALSIAKGAVLDIGVGQGLSLTSATERYTDVFNTSNSGTVDVAIAQPNFFGTLVVEDGVHLILPGGVSNVLANAEGLTVANNFTATTGRTTLIDFKDSDQRLYNFLDKTAVTTASGTTSFARLDLGKGSLTINQTKADNAAAAPTTLNDGVYSVFAGEITGQGGLIKAGDKAFSVNNAVTYYGVTSVAAGTLTGVATNTFANSGALVVGPTGIFDASGKDQAFGGLFGATGAKVSMGAGNLTIGLTTAAESRAITESTGTVNTILGTTTNADASIAGSARTQAFLAARYLASTVAVETAREDLRTKTITSAVADKSVADLQKALAKDSRNAALQSQLATAQTAASTASTAKTTATTAYADAQTAAQPAATAAASTMDFAGVISGGGKLIKIGSQTLNLTGVNTYTGVTDLQGGTLQVDSDAIATSTQVDIAAGATLAINATGATETFSQAVTGGAGAHLAKVGTGTLTFDFTKLLATGAAAGSAYSGDITVSAGTLVADIANTSLTATPSKLTLGSIALLGSGTFSKKGAGTLELGNVNAFTGTFDVQAGELDVAIATGTTLSATAVNVASGAIFSASTTSGPQALAGTLTGAGTVRIASAITLNTPSPAFTGVLSVYGSGTLTAGTDGLAPLGRLEILGVGAGNTATFDDGTTLQSFRSITGTPGAGAFSALVLGGTLTITDGESQTYGGSITGAGTLVKNGSGTQKLTTTTRNAGWTGGVTVNAGVLDTTIEALGGDATTPTPLGATAILGGKLLISSATDATFASGSLSGAGILAKKGAGILTLAIGGSTFTGSLAVEEGTLAVDGNSRSGNPFANVSTLANTTYAVTMGGATGTGPLTHGSAAGSDSTNSISGVGSLQVSGANTLTLAGVQNYTGLTVLKNGATLAFDPTASVTGITGIAMNGLAGDATTHVNLTVPAAARLTINQTIAATYAGDFTGSPVNLTLVGGAELTLTAASTTVDNLVIGGATTGNLHLTGNLVVVSTVTVNGTGSVLKVDGAMTDSPLPGTGSLVVNGGTLALTDPSGVSTLGITLNSATLDITVSSAASPLTYNNTITTNGTSSLSKSGAGELILANSGSGFTGNLTVNAGKLTVGSAASLPTVAEITVAGGAELSLTVGTNSYAMSGANLTGAAGSTLTLGTATLTLNETGTTAFAGTLSGATGALVKNGSGTLTLAGATTLGATTVNLGGLTLTGSANTLGTTTVTAGKLTLSGTGNTLGATTLTGGELALTGTGTTTTGTLSGAGTVSLATGGTLAVAQAAAGELSGAITGSGNLIKNGASTLTLSGSTTLGTGIVLGATRVNDGTLAVTGNGASLGTTTVAAGKTLALSGTGAALGATSVSGTVSVATGKTATVTGALTGTGQVALTGGMIVNHTDTVTADIFGGVFTGAGTLDKRGLGTLVLTGDSSTFTGATTVTSGKLQIGNGGTAGNLGTGSLTNNATVEFNRSNAVPFATAISGSGSLIQSGTGALMLTANSTYTGATSIATGAKIIVGNGGTTGTLGNGTGVIANAGTIEFNRSNTVTVGNAISGAGSLAQTGTGTLELTGANTYMGVTTVSAGHLIVGTASLPQGTFAATSGTLTFKGTGAATIAKDISGTGAVDFTGTNGTTTLMGGFSATGDLAVRSGHTLRLGTDAAHTATLASLKATVDAGGTLKGSGAFAGSLTNNGTVSPGFSPGLIVVAGDYANNGTLNMEIAGNGNHVATPWDGLHDQINFGGTATLGGTLTVSFTPGFTPAVGTTTVLLHDTNTSDGKPSFTGNFINMTVPTGRLLVSGGELLYFNGTTLAAISGLSLHDGVSGLADALTPNSTVVHPAFAQFTALQTAQGNGALATALQNASAVGLASLTALPIGQVQKDADDIRRRAESQTLSRDAIYGDEAEWVTYVAANGGLMDHDKGDSSASFDTTSFGGVVGIEHRLGDEGSAALGVRLSYDRGAATLHNSGGNVAQDHARATVYGLATLGDNAYLAAGLGMGYSSYDTARHTLNGTQKASPTGFDLSGTLDAGFLWKLNKAWTFTPHAGVGFVSSRVAAFTEKGSDLALAVDGFTQNSVYARVGTGLYKEWQGRNVSRNALRMGVDVSLEHELLDNTVEIQSSFATFPQAGGFSTQAPALIRDRLVIGPQAAWMFDETRSVSAGYRAEIGFDGSIGHRFDITFEQRF